MERILAELYRTITDLSQDMGRLLARSEESARDLSELRYDMRQEIRSLTHRVTSLERQRMVTGGMSRTERRLKWLLTITLPVLTLFFTGQADNAVKLFQAAGQFVTVIRSPD